MKQEIQIADKPTLDEIKELLENSGYGLAALKLLLSNSEYGLSSLKTLISSKGGGGYYKPVNSLAGTGTQTLNFYGKGKIKIFTNNYTNSPISITSLDIDGLPNHIVNMQAKFNRSIEIEFNDHCSITLVTGSYFFNIYHYQYVTS